MSANVGALYGTLIWGGVLYDATATGLEAMKPMAYIGVLYLIATVLVFRAGHEDGWRFTFSISGDHGGIDTRNKFLATYDKQGRAPVRTPRWLNACFGILMGAT